MMDGANGFRLIRQRHDFQYVHYVVHGRESFVLIIWLNDPAAVVVPCDVAVAVAGMILLSLASFSLVLRVHASPKFVLIFSCCEEKRNKKIENHLKYKIQDNSKKPKPTKQ
jgi:hypothetical protein